jgi:hypothetical protein
MSELNQALERLHLCGFEYAESVPNYGSIAAEALESLGHAALISGLMDAYVARLPVLAEGRPLREGERKGARGEMNRVADWLAGYERALDEAPWRTVLAEAFAPSGEDLAASRVGFHGLVRVGHAVRSLSREDSRVRRRELAFALAYAAARCEPRAEACDADDPDAWVERARGMPEERNAIGELLSAVCLRAAECYLADPDDRMTRSMALVVPGAIRLLTPHLSAIAAKQVLVGVLSRIGDSLVVRATARRFEASERSDDSEVERCANSPSEIRYRAACSVHEHAIAMTEACLREDAVKTHPTLLRAAADAALRLSPPGYREWR